MPCYAYFVWNSKPGVWQLKLIHTLWACSVGPGLAWRQLQPWGLCCPLRVVQMLLHSPPLAVILLNIGRWSHLRSLK